jgi:hypothetical protein
MVVEDIIEEKVGKISKAIQGFRKKITELEVNTTLGTPLEEREKRERTVQTMVVKIKQLEQEFIKICEEGTRIWTDMKNTLELQVIKKKNRVA